MKKFFIGFMMIITFIVPVWGNTRFDEVKEEYAKNESIRITTEDLIECMDIKSIEWNEAWECTTASYIDTRNLIVATCFNVEEISYDILAIEIQDMTDSSVENNVKQKHQDKDDKENFKEIDYSTDDYEAILYLYDMDECHCTDYILDVGTQTIFFSLVCPLDGIEESHEEEILEMLQSIVV